MEKRGRADGDRRQAEFQKMYPWAGGLAAVVLFSLIALSLVVSLLQIKFHSLLCHLTVLMSLSCS